MFADGLVRFATTPYQPAKKENLGDLFMHLTNYAINKKSSNYVQNNGEDSNQPQFNSMNDMGKQFADESAHKRSLKSLYVYLDKLGYNTKDLQTKIDDIIIKTIIISQPSLNHIYKSCHPDDEENSHCF